MTRVLDLYNIRFLFVSILCVFLTHFPPVLEEFKYSLNFNSKVFYELRYAIYLSYAESYEYYLIFFLDDSFFLNFI